MNFPCKAQCFGFKNTKWKDSHNSTILSYTVTAWGWIHSLGSTRLRCLVIVLLWWWCVWPRPWSRVCGVILANDPESTSISLLSTEHYPKAIKQDYW